MIREEYLQRLVENSYIDLFLSGNVGARIDWPWKMQPAHRTSRRYRETCDIYYIDSAFNRDDIDTVDVLDAATRLDADAAALVDKYGDYEGTISRLLDGIETYRMHEYDGKLILPLQPDHATAAKEIITRSDIDPIKHIWGIGGVNTAGPHTQFNSAKETYDVLPNEATIHGLGFQPESELISYIHRYPFVLDSVDYSTPIQRAIDTATSGDERMSEQAAHAGARLISDLRKCSDFISDIPDTNSDIDLTTTQSTLNSNRL